MPAWNPQANDIFLAVLELPSRAEREAYLKKSCDGQADLAAQVQSLLAASESAGDFLESPPSAVLAVGQAALPVLGATSHPAEVPGTRIGPYKLLQQLGEGGFGVVYMAEQQQPVRRKVALKIIKPGMDTKEVIARFESERQALALMDHPNIAKVLDAGATDSGRPYFVMELVKGIPITEYCDSNHLPPDERLELFIQVCNALQHAHQKGIIHRDLKPSNVMVTMHDGRPVPKVIDFGVAKATSQTLTERTLFTAYGQMIGTPAYMSPEQAEMSCLDIDTRADIYSLGVLLYELLTGTTPLEAKRLREAGFAEMQRIIREEEPESVSTRIAKITKARSAELGARNITFSTPRSALRAPRSTELDWIVSRSLEKDRERRYESASSFARDLRRYLADEPVQACPPSTLYRFRKFARKNRAAISTAVVIATSLLLGTAVSTWQAVQAAQARDAEAAQRQRAEESEREAKERLAEANEQRKQAERNFEAALDAVDRMLANVGDRELNDVPRIGPLRRKMLKDAIAFYERIPTQSGLSPDTRLHISETWHNVGRLSRNYNEYSLALDAFAKESEVLQQLSVEQPNEIKYRTKLANSFTAVGWMHNGQLRDPKEAGKFLRRATDVYASLVRDHPHDRLLVIAYVNSLVSSGSGDDQEELRRWLNRAVDLLDRVEATELERASFHLRAAGLLRAKPVEADELRRRAISAYRGEIQAGKAEPYDRWEFPYRLWRAAVSNNLWQRSPDDSEAWLDESIALYRETYRDNRAQSLYLVRSLTSQAGILRRRAALPKENDQDRAGALLQKADSLAKEALTRQREMISRFTLDEDRAGLVNLLQQEVGVILDRIAKGLPVFNTPDGASEDATATKLRADALLTEAIQLCRALAAEFPDNADYKTRLAALLKLQAQHFGPKADGKNPK